MENNCCNEIDINNANEIVLTHIEYNEILNMQQQILEMVASHTETSNILNKLCSLAEALLPNSVASIMLKDESSGLMSVISAPSVPQVGHDALSNLKPGAKVVHVEMPFFIMNHNMFKILSLILDGKI